MSYKTSINNLYTREKHKHMHETVPITNYEYHTKQYRIYLKIIEKLSKNKIYLLNYITKQWKNINNPLKIKHDTSKNLINSMNKCHAKPKNENKTNTRHWNDIHACEKKIIKISLKNEHFYTHNQENT